MSKNVPTSYSGPAPNKFATGEIIFASDFEAIADAQAFEHSRSAGFTSVGWSFDPISEFTSSTFTQTASANKSLSDLMWVTDFFRLTNLSGNLRYRIWLVIIGYEIQVRLNVRSPGGSSTTATASQTASNFSRATAVITGFSSGSGPQIFELEARQNGAGSTAGLAQVQVLAEKYISAAFLPQG